MTGTSWGDEEDPLDFEATDEMLRSLDFAAPAEDEGEIVGPTTSEYPEPLSVTVTNPPGTVSVTVLIDGSPRSVELAPRAASDMTESELAKEILLISRLARQNAQAGQHLLVSAILEGMGHDPVATRSSLEHDLKLPSVETALTDKAQIFATRYTADDA
jgi:hypothetical protein